MSDENLDAFNGEKFWTRFLRQNKRSLAAAANEAAAAQRLAARQKALNDERENRLFLDRRAAAAAARSGQAYAEWEQQHELEQIQRQAENEAAAIAGAAVARRERNPEIYKFTNGLANIAGRAQKGLRSAFSCVGGLCTRRRERVPSSVPQVPFQIRRRRSLQPPNGNNPGVNNPQGGGKRKTRKTRKSRRNSRR
jgi:hypothetical protein